MADIGLNQNISIRDRQFHIQTSTDIEDGAIRTEVFDKGRLLYSEFYTYERRDFGSNDGMESRLRRVVDQFHRSVISGLETLFDLSNIIKENNHTISNYRIGTIFLALNLYDKAEQHLMRAIDIDTHFYSAYIKLAQCYYIQNHYQQALSILEPLIKEDVDYPDLYNLLGIVLLEQKKYAQSLNYLRHALKLNSSYREAFYNLSLAILQRIGVLRMQDKVEEIQKNLEFFSIILNKISNTGDQEDKATVSKIKKLLPEKNYGKIQTILKEFREAHFFQRIPSEIIGYELYLWLRYLPDRLDYDILQYFEGKITWFLNDNPDYPDMWNYLALIHLMLCRDYFLRGLDNFKEATKINPSFTKAKKNLRLVENDGREFLSLIKAIVK